jgi:uncharacterized protein (TIGR02145 family)
MPSYRILGLALAIGVSAATQQPGVEDPRDSRRYPIITIGPLQWLGRNLEFAMPSSWCYQDDARDCAANGRLYEWTAAMRACPAGWTLPSDEDWMTLETALGMAISALRAEGARGTNQGTQLLDGGQSGFNVLVTGYRRPAGDYARRGERAAFWTRTEADNTAEAWHRDVRPSVGTIYRSPVTKTYALSVRCVRPSTAG